MPDPRAFNLPERTILPDTSNDRLGLALIAMMREVWIIKDRMMVLETILEQQGLEVTSAIEAFEPDAALEERLQTEGSALIHAFTAILSEKPL